jgi:hypothetical protein
MPQKLARRIGPATLELERQGAGVYLKVTVSENGSTWRGTAAFPLVAQDEALEQFDRIETPTDLEDLLRAWAGSETWASYQEFRNRYGF